MNCPKCKVDVQPAWEFCSKCGTKLKLKPYFNPELLKQVKKGKVVCWNCKKILAASAKELKEYLEKYGNVFCTKCGQPQNIRLEERKIREQVVEVEKEQNI